MPKLKTHRGAAKRFKKTGTGKIVRASAFKRHILTSKETKSKRHKRGTKVVSDADAKKLKRVALAQLNEAWEKFDLLLAPSARGEAPSGLGNTGDPIFNRFWTLLGAPCIALPFNTGPFGLPLSVQLIGPRGRDDQLIAWARWAERQLS